MTAVSTLRYAVSPLGTFTGAEVIKTSHGSEAARVFV